MNSEPYIVQLNVGGDQLDYEFNTGSPDDSILETKIAINSTISDAHEGSRFISADMKDHFLPSTMDINRNLKT